MPDVLQCGYSGATCQCLYSYSRIQKHSISLSNIFTSLDILVGRATILVSDASFLTPVPNVRPVDELGVRVHTGSCIPLLCPHTWKDQVGRHPS